MGMEEREQRRDTLLGIRGAYDVPGEKVDAGVPAVLTPLAEGRENDRLAFARWLVERVSGFLDDGAATGTYTVAGRGALRISRAARQGPRSRAPAAASRATVRPRSQAPEPPRLPFRLQQRQDVALPDRALHLAATPRFGGGARWDRSEEHTSELQPRTKPVCRLSLEKQKQYYHT